MTSALKGDKRQHRKVLTPFKVGWRKLPRESKSKLRPDERPWGCGRSMVVVVVVSDYGRIPGNSVKIGQNTGISKK